MSGNQIIRSGIGWVGDIKVLNGKRRHYRDQLVIADLIACAINSIGKELITASRSGVSRLVA